MTQPVELTRGGTEREARPVNAPFLRFSLRDEAARLRAERPYLESDRNAATLAKNAWFRMTLVALRAGARMDEADQRGIVAFHVLEGALDLRVGDDAGSIGEGGVGVIAPGHPWAAEATADSLVLLQLAWPPDPASISTIG
jgi:quercetin dioxygenase-like cupin family protein